jgi:lipoyl(octanoyl) transferase
MIALTPTWLMVDLGQIDYQDAHSLQIDLVSARQDGRIEKNVLLLLEHSPIFTVGRRGDRRNLKIDEDELRRCRIAVVSVERGGDITYHGPGQLVGYPIVELEKNELDVSRFVWKLEEVMIRTAADFCLSAVRDHRNPGVWVRGKKLGNIGIAVRKGITFHGFALNVHNDLKPFSWINPCGLQGVGVTSLSVGKAEKVAICEAKKRVMVHIKDVFGVKLEITDNPIRKTGPIKPLLFK